MIPSPEGLLVCAVLLVVGSVCGSALIAGLLASLPFGSTAWGALPALGGSTPLIYTFFVLLLVAVVALRRDLLRRLGSVFLRAVTPWVLVILGVYAAVGSYILPRLFSGQTTAFAPVEGEVVELPLMPVSGNITQTAYFILGIVTFFALSALFMKEENLRALRNGYFTYVILHAGLGLVDLGAKLAGLGDVLLPIRTASYALLTEVEEAGFARIAGGYPEASSFAASSLVGLAFAYTYWRRTGSFLAMGLAALLLFLVLLSTSTTAYVGLAILMVAPGVSIGWAALKGRLTARDLSVTAMGAVTVTVLLGTFIANEKIFEPAVGLFRRMVLEKAESESGKQRSYWNERSLVSVADTGGLGIGMGSSRSSSWAISVVSQLGVAGALAFSVLAAVICRGMGGLRRRADTEDFFTLAASLRAGALALLLGGCISGGAADPGILFFISLAGILACRAHVEQRQQDFEKRGWD